MTETVRRHICPSDSFPHKIAHYADEKARVAEEAMVGPYASPNAGRHGQALKALAKYVRTLDLNEPRLEALWVINSRVGGGDEFTPQANQREVFSGLGLERPAPPPIDVVSELVAAGLEDVLAAHAEVRQTIDGLNTQIARLEPFRAQVGELEAELDKARSELAEAHTENARLTEQRDFFADQRAADPAPPRKVRKKPSGNTRKPAGASKGA